MKMSMWKLAALAALFLVQWAVPGSLIWKHERALTKGAAYRFRTAPVDPYDAFRGRYVSLDFADRQYPVDPGHAWKGSESVFVRVEEDEDGFARVAGLSKDRPVDDGDWFAAAVQWRSADTVHISFPFNRFYMKETLAPQAEDAYRSAMRDTNQEAWAVVRIYEGLAVLDELYLNGVPIADLVRERETTL